MQQNSTATTPKAITYYKVICVLTALLFAYLFVVLLVNSESFLNGLGLASSVTTYFLARRASVFMLGLSVLLFSVLNLEPSPARQRICISTGVVMLGLATDGTYELLHGNINATIIPPILIEVSLGVSFLVVAVRNHKRLR